MSKGNAVITGASSGIGEAVALSLAKDGYNVALLARKVEKLQSLANKITTEFKVQAHVVACDMTSKDSVSAATKQVAILFPQVHVLINNAGVSGKAINALEANFEDWEEVIQVNLLRTMQLTRELLPNMKDAQRSFVIFISSIAAKLTFGKMSQYHASKFGINGFAGSLFEDVREFGIRVVSIMPGFVNTNMTSEMKGVNPAKMIQPEDIANTVQYCVHSPENCCPTEIVLRPQFSPYAK